MTLTRISLATAAVTAVVNVLVLFGIDVSADQLAAINAAVIAVGTAVHAWYNPNVPIGNRKEG